MSIIIRGGWNLVKNPGLSNMFYASENPAESGRCHNRIFTHFRHPVMEYKQSI